MHDIALLITSEHAVNFVPEPWQDLFKENADVLDSHRGWDAGSFDLAQSLAKEFSAPCIAAKVSRLLVDHNRSPHNRSLWSEYSRELSAREKGQLLEQYYNPFREQASRWIADQHADGKSVLHLSVHSFTPVLDGKVRDVDIGLLYDTNRSDEAFFADLWKNHIAASSPELKVRFNVPYRGRSDCHLTSYRNIYKSGDFSGIELEVNQSLVTDAEGWKGLKQLIKESLHSALCEVATDE